MIVANNQECMETRNPRFSCKNQTLDQTTCFVLIYGMLSLSHAQPVKPLLLNYCFNRHLQNKQTLFL